MKTIYLIRHAKASMEGKDAERLLSPEGTEQAEQLAVFLNSLNPKISRLFSSDFVRALETLKPFNLKAGLPLEALETLREVNMAFPKDCDNLEFRKQFWSDDAHKAEGGESRKEANDRILEVLRTIAESMSDDEAVGVMTHGTLGGVVLKAFDLNYGFEDWKKMSMPDVFKLSFQNNALQDAQVEHIGCGEVKAFVIT